MWEPTAGGNDLKRLHDKVALVTGSSRGFGRAIALAYVNEGAKVVSVAREAEELDDFANVVRSRGGHALTIPVDLSRDTEIERMKTEVLETYGKLDILVNNAAVSKWKTMEEMGISEWDYTIAVNLRAPFLISKVFLDTMKMQGGAAIINISSLSGEQGFVSEMGYCSSKYGLEGLTQCMAAELRRFNIAVNSLNVGTLPGKNLKPTGLTLAEERNMPARIRQRYPDDDLLVKAFSEAWIFLALQNGSGVTGQRFRTKELTEFLQQNGWEAAVETWRGKLTRAVYESYDFPNIEPFYSKHEPLAFSRQRIIPTSGNETKFCKTCGARIPSTANFCGSCSAHQDNDIL